MFLRLMYVTQMGCDRRSVALPRDSVNCKHNCDNVTVTTRIFYNCQKENVKALFSRGNKRRLLIHGRLKPASLTFTELLAFPIPVTGVMV